MVLARSSKLVRVSIQEVNICLNLEPETGTVVRKSIIDKVMSYEVVSILTFNLPTNNT